VKLTGPEIGRRVAAGTLGISGFQETRLNPNSYNLTLAPRLLVYRPRRWWTPWRRPLVWGRTNPPDAQVVIPPRGYRLRPGWFYLGSTIEWTDTQGLAPSLNGRSTGGRLSLHIHATAGFGDNGFRGTWTLEIYCLLPVVVFPGIEIGQISYEVLLGEESSYQGHYQDQEGPTVAASFARNGYV
jgi:dCTP deaminase